MALTERDKQKFDSIWDEFVQRQASEQRGLIKMARKAGLHTLVVIMCK